MFLNDNDVDREKKLNLYKEIYPEIKKYFNSLTPVEFENKYLSLMQEWKRSDLSNTLLQLKLEVSIAIFEEFLSKDFRCKQIQQKESEKEVKVKRPPTIKN